MSRELRRYALMLYADNPDRDRVGPVFAVDDATMLARLTGDLELIIKAFSEGELRRVDDGELLWRKGRLDG